MKSKTSITVLIGFKFLKLSAFSLIKIKIEYNCKITNEVAIVDYN